MLYRQNRKRNYSIALLLSMSFLLHFTAAPHISTNNNCFNQNNYQPYTQYGEVYIIRDYSGSELLGNAEIKYLTVRNLKDLQRLFNRPFDAVVLSIFTFCIQLIYISAYHKKWQRRLPVMGAFLGGHAPPACLYI